MNDCIADVVIEAIVEKPEAKVAILTSWPNSTTGETIFCQQYIIPLYQRHSKYTAPKPGSGHAFFLTRPR